MMNRNKMNIKKWINQDKPLENYRGSFSYSIIVTKDMQNQLKNFRQINFNPKLSMQIIYRDGLIEDFWPIWEKQEDDKKRHL